jgi:YVTN family beta-propeller protein
MCSIATDRVRLLTAVRPARRSVQFLVCFAVVSLGSAAVANPVYIPLGDANSILIVDSADDRVAARIDDVPGVHGLAMMPDGRHLIAGSMDERPSGATAPDKPDEVSEEEHAAHHPQPGATVASDSISLSTVSVIDTRTKKIVRRIDVPGAVHHVAVDPLGRYAAVTHPGTGAITAIDLATFQVAATIPTGPFANYAAFSPDGSRLYVSNAGNETVSEIDVERWIVRRNAVVDDSPEHLVLAADGARLYINNVNAGTVSVIDAENFEVTETLTAGVPLHGIDLDEDGSTLFVAVLGEDRVVAFDLEGGAAREVKLGPAPYHVAAITGTGKLYISSSEEPKLWILDQETLALRGEISIEGKGHQIALSPRQ